MSADETHREMPRAADGSSGPVPSTRSEAANTAGAVPVESLQQQADLLGVLDPLDVEPAHVFIVDKWST